MVHFNWLQLIPGIGYHYTHVGIFILTGLFLIFIGLLARRTLIQKDRNGTFILHFIPAKYFSIKSIFELVVEFISDLSESIIGEKGRFFTPLFSSLFLFIVVTNFVGLLPGMENATGNLNTTLSMGLVSFFFYNFYGFKTHGISYLKQLIGPVLLLAPLMILIELISHLARPLSLGLRLYGSMLGDHAVLGIFLKLIPFLIPVVFYLFSAFFCFVQAFIFTVLSMVYMSLALSEEH